MKKILKSTFLVSFATLISRILGVARDVLIANIFGADLYTDIFFLCFRAPDFLRKMFSEGILSSAFIPVFSRYHDEQGKTKAFEMFNSALVFISVSASVITISGIIFAPMVITFLFPEFAANSYEFSLGVLVSRIMMPYLIFIFLLAVCMGALNSMESFISSAFAPVIFNIIIILFTLAVCKYFDPPVIGLALGVTIGGLTQLIFQIPFLKQNNIFNINKLVFFHPGVIKFLKRLFPSIIGAGSFHFNLLVASFFASFLGKGNISCLYYADRLVQLPMALFSVSISIVFLPLFSRQAAKKDKSLMVFLHALRFLFFLIIPAMAGLILLREPIVKLFFFHGAFDLAAVNNTSEILLFLVLGLWSYAGTRIFVSFFHGRSDMRTPFIAGAVSILFNFILSMVLVNIFGFKGLAISISISGVLNFLILFIQLQSKKLLSYKDIGFSACRAVFISGIMYFVIKILILQINKISGFELPNLVNIAISITIGVLVYFILNLLIKSPEIKLIRYEVLRAFKNK